MKLTEKQTQIVNYIKENGRVSVQELAEALDTTVKSVNGTLTSLGVNGPNAKGLVDYEKVEVEGSDKPCKYAFLTEAGKNFVPTED